jgi:hypothetical protein
MNEIVEWEHIAVIEGKIETRHLAQEMIDIDREWQLANFLIPIKNYRVSVIRAFKNQLTVEKLLKTEYRWYFREILNEE